MKKIVLMVAALGLVFAVAVYFSGRKAEEVRQFSYTQGTVALGGEEFRVDIADTEEKRNQGLGGREGIGKNEGMLFVFGESLIPTFWMKGMKFPIDIIWIRGNTVIGFAENAQPESSGEGLKLYQAPGFVSYVLEVSAGTVERLTISPGTAVVIQ